MHKTARHSLLILGLLAGCSGEQQEGLDAQELTRVAEAGEGSACENGGVVIASGSDENKDGKLDDDEVKDERVVCNGESLPDPGKAGALRRVDALADGSDECPAGGVAIHSGVDDNRDRELADKEIDDTQIVCNSPDHKVITQAVTIAVGSEECLYGGKRIDAGSDDGAGKGKADDGVLAADEVDTSYVDCDTSPPVRAESITPPGGAVGKAEINLVGGDGNNAAAGAGGSFNIQASVDEPGCVPAITKVFTTGKVDASFVVPTLAIDLGSEDFVVSKDTTLTSHNETDNHNVGQYYYLDGSIVRATDAGSGYATVTGLRIAAGATLTLPTAQATLRFVRDVEILGELALPPSEARYLVLSARQVSVGAEGLIEISQTGLTTTTGIRLDADSQMVFLGTLLAQGAEPGLGGAAVAFHSGGRMVLDGKIDVSGADAPAGTGGPGGSFNAWAFNGGVWSGANVDASGGNGISDGGIGGTIQLGYDDSNEPLDLRNTGALNAAGGVQTDASCFADLITCRGGIGGSVRLFASLANLANTGTLKVKGGDGAKGAGNGGTILTQIKNAGTPSLPDARLGLSGSVDANGGEGTSDGAGGGAGGTLTVLNCTGADSVAELLGYAGLHAHGGVATGQGTGGAGGSALITSAEDVPSPRRLYLNVPLDLSGGQGFNAGNGGFLNINLSARVKVDNEVPAGLPSLILDGDHAVFGGDATPKSGYEGGGGNIRIVTRADMSLSGSLTTSAGAGLNPQSGSYGGSILIESILGALSNSASLSANGANNTSTAATFGGSGGCMSLEGQTLVNSGALTARGGAGVSGGAGGTIALMSHAAPGKHTGTFDVSGGEGNPDGTDGLAGFDLPSCGKR